jgi:hypothetical protein
MMSEHLEDGDQIPADDDIELSEVNPFEAMGNILNAAMTKATEQIEKIADAIETYPTAEEIAQWSNPDWPHTPPLSVFRVLEQEDPNLRWRVEIGHIMNLLDAAIEKLEGLGIFPDPEPESDDDVSTGS